MTDCATATYGFAAGLPLPVQAAFNGGALTSDGGLPWLAVADRTLGICAALAAALPDWRQRPGSVSHSVEQLVRQRVCQIACGYEDQNDATTRRHDPLLKLVCGRLPQTGLPLASQPTISRLENAADRRACFALAVALVACYVRERERLAGGPPHHLLLDLDSTDDPVHGHQEGERYHGYFRQHQYHPLLIFDGATQQLIVAVLRRGNAHAARNVVWVLRRLIAYLRQCWPGVTIELRGDSGFAAPRLYTFCEQAEIGYTLGLATNARLEDLAAPLLAEAQRQQAERAGEKVRLLDETLYRAGSWERERRVILKAEALAKGPNTRFVVTTRTEPPDALYTHYTARGETENWIKDLKHACFADRLSCCRFLANQVRLFFHAAAYTLLHTLRGWLIQAGLARLQLDTLRLCLLKVGGWVRQHLHHVRLALASSHPAQPLWAALDHLLLPLRE